MKRAQDTIKETAHLDPDQAEHLQELIRFAGTQLAIKRRRR